MKGPKMGRREHRQVRSRWRVWALLLLLPGLVGFEGTRAREALDLAFHNLYGADVLVAVEMRMDGDGRPPLTVGYAYGRKHKADEVRTLMYVAGAERSSQRALLLQRPGERDRLYVSDGLYKDARPVSANAAAWTLFDSDFGYEDLRTHRSDEYGIEVLGSDVVAGEPTRVLRLRPLGGPYEQMLVWLSTDRPVFLRIDYFDRKGLWKRYRAEPKQIRRHLQWWVPMADEMLDLRTGRRTRRTVRNIIVDTSVPDELFTLSQLSRGRMPSF